MSSRTLYTALAVLALLATPSATAAAVSGSLAAEGPLQLPAGSAATFRGLRSVLIHETAGFSGFTLRADAADVEVVEQEYLILPASVILANGEQKTRTWHVTSITAAPMLGGDHAGYMSIEGDDRSSFSAEIAKAAKIEPRDESKITNEIARATPGPEEMPTYEKVVQGPHAYANLSTTGTAAGAVAVRISGLDLVVSATENATAAEWRSGFVQTSQTSGVYRWFNVRFTGAALQIPTVSHIEVASEEVDLAWNGEASLRATGGLLISADGEYRPMEKKTTLDGDLAATLIPRKGNAADIVDLHGDLRETSLAFQRAPVSRSLGGNDTLLNVALLLAVAVGAGAVGRHVWKHHRDDRERQIDDAIAMASHASELGDFKTALRHITRAREISRTRPDLALDYGFVLARLNRKEEALAAFKEAHEQSQDGHAALHRARLLDLLEAPVEDVLTWAGYAFDRTPELIRDVSDHDLLRAREAPEWDQLVKKTHRRIEQAQRERQGRS